MTITKTQSDATLTIAIEGRLDTTTSPQLEAEYNAAGNFSELVLDLARLDYISSAGLRVILAMQKLMNQKGSMVVRNVKPEVMEVFELTGFVDILTIENS